MPKSVQTIKEKKKENLNIIEKPVKQENQDLEKKSIKIRISTIENIQETNVKLIIQHADKILGESEITTLQEKIETVINFEVALWYIPSKMKSLDEIAANPVLFIINECNTNQNAKNHKSSKESKKSSREDLYNVQPLGQCNLDLFPLFLGELSIHENLLIHQVKKIAPQEMLTWPNLPRLTVFVSTEEPLVTPKQFDSMNILFITLESMNNILPRMTERMQYSAATVFPLQSTDFETVFFHNGIYKTTKQMDKSKRWTGLSNLPGRSSYSLYNLNEETIRSNLTIDLNAKLNEDIPRIEWNMLRRCLMTTAGGESMYDILAKYSCWILEIMVTDQQEVTNKAKTTDTAFLKMHYVAYLDFSSLLYPGVTKVRAAAQVFTYNQEDVTSKFGLEKALFESTGPEPLKGESSSVTKVKPPISSGTKTRKSDQKSSSKTISQPAPTPVEESVPLFKEDGDPVFVILEMELFKPLMRKRTSELLQTLISQIIPPRPPLPKRVMAAELAEKHYSSCIRTLSEVISKEYQKFMQITDETDHDDFHTSFLYSLNSSGIYDEMKTDLKNKISVLLKEKSEIKPELESNLTKQNYVSKVYIYLVEEMHATLNTLIENDYKSTEDLSTISTDMMLFFAMEADEIDLFDNANHWYFERILRNNKNPDFWLDYGIFYLKHGQQVKAIENIREALTLDTRHKIGLLLYATLLAQDNEYRIAEIFFDALTHFYPRFAEAWITFHLFYLKTENYVGAEIALKMSTKCFDSMEDLESVINTESLLWCPTNYNNDSLFLITAITLIKLHIPEFAEMALAQELVYNSTSIPYLYYLSVLHYLEGRYEDAIGHITSAVKQHGKDYCLWSLMGHCHHELGNKTMAMECYQHVVDSFNRPNDIHLVELRLGEYYLEEANYEKARILFLSACKYTPTPLSWLFLGITCYKMKNYEEAEIALKEGNALHNKQASIWGYLALINLQFERRSEFDLCYRQAIRAPQNDICPQGNTYPIKAAAIVKNKISTSIDQHGLEDQSIIQEIKILQKTLNYRDPVPLIHQ